MADFRRQVNSNAIFPSEDDAQGSRVSDEFENNGGAPLHMFCKKPSSRPSTKRLLLFGHILGLKVS